jgi:hypothetical protein
MASTGMTSYERVYRALFKTETCVQGWKTALEAIDTIKITEVKWRLDMSDSGAKAVASFVMSGDAGTWGETNLDQLELAARTFMTEELAREVISKHFGPDKDVKTFNCNESIVRRGGNVSRKTKWGREQCYQEDFRDFLVTRFAEEAQEKLRMATAKIKADIIAMKGTEEFRKARHEALVEFCKEHISKALMPWHGMEDSVLQDAWDRFICKAIMDP